MGQMYSYEVLKAVYPGGATKPYRIIEKYETCDGTRSRLTNRCFSSFVEAKFECDRLESTQ